MGSVPCMQGEISHWQPLTDGGLTARCNTDPREYQVSPHYTLHGLFQLPMLPSLIGITETTPKQPKDIAGSWLGLVLYHLSLK